MGKFERECVLNWHGGGKKKVLFYQSTNTPIFSTAPSSHTCCAFVMSFEALEASYYRRETVPQYPGCNIVLTDDEHALVLEEFVAKENLNYFQKEVSDNEEVVDSDNMMVKHPTYWLLLRRRAHLRLSAADPSALTLHFHRRRGRTSILPPPTIRPNLCAGTTAFVTYPISSSSSLPSMGKSPRNWQNSYHSSVLAVSLVL